MVIRTSKFFVFALAAATVSFSAEGPVGRPDPPPALPGLEQGPPAAPPPPLQPHRGPLNRTLRIGPGGRWWSDEALAQKLGLSADQQRRMDELFQQSRLKLIDLHADLEKQELILEPLLADDHPNESKVLAQIDRIAQARAELEKANARMLLGIRAVLTQDQWKRLQAERPARPGIRRR